MWRRGPVRLGTWRPQELPGHRLADAGGGSDGHVDRALNCQFGFFLAGSHGIL
jgi:hypothetical protein